MADARVFIDLNEGLIEAEGPLDFVKEVIERYLPQGKTAQIIPRKAPRTVEALKPMRKRRRSAEACRKTLDVEVQDGFFSKARGFGEIKERLAQSGNECADNAIRTALKKLIEVGNLASSGAARGMRYIQI